MRESLGVKFGPSALIGSALAPSQDVPTNKSHVANVPQTEVLEIGVHPAAEQAEKKVIRKRKRS
jgi:hypothetical protein